MYVIMQLAQSHSNPKRSNAPICRGVASLTPGKLLRTTIVLRPGFWWPMSAGKQKTQFTFIEHGNGKVKMTQATAALWQY